MRRETCLATIILTCVFAILLSGCGMSVPQIQEFWGTPADAANKEAAIAQQVECELGRAIRQIRNADRALPLPRLGFLDKWAAQVVLLLSVDEKSSLSPGVSIVSPLANKVTTFGPGNTVTSGQSFTGSFGGSYSNEAKDIDKVYLFYELKNLDNDEFVDRTCKPQRANADLFAESDLDIYNWLQRNLNLHEFQLNDLSQSHIDNVLSHDITFEIVSSGNVTPTWKLVRFVGNVNSPFFNGSRDRTQELIITLGPKNKVGGGLSSVAASAAASSEFGASLATRLNNNAN